MGALIQIVGNLGVGKTTLAAQIAASLPATPYWEAPVDRPFQVDFVKDKRRWALANQVDFFIFRAEQERVGRASSGFALYDGGLDQDYWVFSRLIAEAGHLSALEQALCDRTYDTLRSFLPSPELTIVMQAPIDTLHARRARRARLNDGAIIEAHFLERFQALLDAWVESVPATRLIQFDASDESFWDQQAVDTLCQSIRQRIATD